MTISEAAQISKEEGRGISRKEWGNVGSFVFPTNTVGCCILFTDYGDRCHPRWQPTFEDLAAEDWYVDA